MEPLAQLKLQGYNPQRMSDSPNDFIGLKPEFRNSELGQIEFSRKLNQNQRISSTGYTKQRRISSLAYQLGDQYHQSNALGSNIKTTKTTIQEFETTNFNLHNLSHIKSGKESFATSPIKKKIPFFANQTMFSYAKQKPKITQIPAVILPYRAESVLGQTKINLNNGSFNSRSLSLADPKRTTIKYTVDQTQGSLLESSICGGSQFKMKHPSHIESQFQNQNLSYRAIVQRLQQNNPIKSGSTTIYTAPQFRKDVVMAMAPASKHRKDLPLKQQLDELDETCTKITIKSKWLTQGPPTVGQVADSESENKNNFKNENILKPSKRSWLNALDSVKNEMEQRRSTPPKGAEAYHIPEKVYLSLFRRAMLKENQQIDDRVRLMSQESQEITDDQKVEVDNWEKESFTSSYLEQKVEVARSQIYNSINKQTQSLSEDTRKQIQYFNVDLPDQKTDFKIESDNYVKYLSLLYKNQFKGKKDFLFKVVKSNMTETHKYHKKQQMKKKFGLIDSTVGNQLVDKVCYELADTDNESPQPKKKQYTYDYSDDSEVEKIQQRKKKVFKNMGSKFGKLIEYKKFIKLEEQYPHCIEALYGKQQDGDQKAEEEQQQPQKKKPQPAWLLKLLQP